MTLCILVSLTLVAKHLTGKHDQAPMVIGLQIKLQLIVKQPESFSMVGSST